MISWLRKGDPNVPATKVSVYGILTSPLVLTLEQQESLDTLAAVPEHHVTEQSGLPVRQPFRVPARIERDNPDIPKFCTFRYEVYICMYLTLKEKNINLYVLSFSKVFFCAD